MIEDMADQGTSPISPILVVEDDAGSREALVDILEIRGYSVQAAANGREAMEKLRGSLRPSLIILDLLMPEMDGWEFRSRQKKDPILAKVPVTAITAFAEARIDAHHVLTKPLDVDHLLNVVQQYVSPVQSV
jgi:CheY-like chemotaxis protein